MSIKTLLLATLVPLATLGIARPALAHNVETNYILNEDAALEIQVMFSTGEPFAEAPVAIYSPNDLETPYEEGITDEEGRFSFNPGDNPEQGEWKMKIGELGHGDILFVPVNDQGIELELIGEATPEHHQNSPYWAVGLALLSAGVTARILMGGKSVDN